jgi:hypothetical protein
VAALHFHGLALKVASEIQPRDCSNLDVRPICVFAGGGDAWSGNAASSLSLRPAVQGRQRPSRFSTIQVRPKDWSAALRQVEREEDRPQGFRRRLAVMAGGTGVKPRVGSPHVQHATARLHHTARRRCGNMATRRAGAAAGDAGDRIPQWPVTEEWVDLVDAVRQGLSQVGFIEGYNVGIEYRFAQNASDRLPALAAELVSRKVRVIVGQWW